VDALVEAGVLLEKEPLPPPAAARRLEAQRARRPSSKL